MGNEEISSLQAWIKSWDGQNVRVWMIGDKSPSSPVEGKVDEVQLGVGIAISDVGQKKHFIPWHAIQRVVPEPDK